MAKNVRANIELGLNVVIAIAVVAVAGVVVKRYLFQQPVNHANAPQHINAGEGLNIPNVNWEQNKKSLVFFLKKDCVYCKASAPFYRQLVAEAAKRDVKCLAVLPNTIEEGREYVKSLELPIADVHAVQAEWLSSSRIAATPTVLFVDHRGIVRSVWVGAAAGPAREKEMRNELVGLF